MASLYKLHIHRWARLVEANLLTVVLAQQAAMSADMIYDLMLCVRSGKVDEHLPPRPKPDQWLSFYGQHRQLTVGVADALPECLGSGQGLQTLLDSTRAVSIWAKNDPDELRAWIGKIGTHRLNRDIRLGWRWAHRRYKRHLKEAAATLRGGPPQEVDDFGARLAASPELLFYFRVTLPCLCLYGRLPVMLLRHARRGCPGALERLARLDDLVIHDPGIMAWVNHSKGATRIERRNQLLQWASEGLDYGQFSPSQVKVSIGAMISVLVESIGGYWDVDRKQMMPGRITAAQIRGLFDAVAKDRATGPRNHIRDPDLSELQPDSLRRMIGRQKRLWRVVVGGGQKFRWV